MAYCLMFIIVRIVKSLDRINFNLKKPRNGKKAVRPFRFDGLDLLLLVDSLFACFAINTASAQMPELRAHRLFTKVQMLCYDLIE